MDLFNIVFYFVLPALALGYWFLKKKHSYFKDRGIPHIKPTSLIFGSSNEIGGKYNFADFIRHVYDETKGKDVIAGFYNLFLPSIIVTDLETVKNITIKDFNTFADRPMYVNEENESVTGHLLAIGGERWRFLRNKFSPAFTSGKIKQMYHTIFDKGDNFINAVEKASRNGSVEMKKLATNFTVDIISSTAFGFEANTLEGENLHIMDVLGKVLGEDGVSQGKFLFAGMFPKFCKMINLRFFHKSVQEFFDKVVVDSITYREKNNVKKNDFLNTLIELKNKGSIDDESEASRKLTMPECIAQAFIFFLGGADTSSYTISYAMAQLGMHPEIQDKLRKEVLEKSANGKLTYENIQEMTYLGQVVNETLRMHPPLPVIIRKALADYKVPNSKHVIEEGSQVIIPFIGFHYDERYWKNPEKFDPDHFTAEEVSKRPNLAFMPFGEGPRNCIGMRFGLMNVKFALAKLITNFRVQLDTTKTSYPLKLDEDNFSMEIKGGCWVRLEKI